MKIFIGSSAEALPLPIFGKVCQWVEAAGHEALRWDSPGTFPLAKYTLEALLEHVDTVDAAILFFTPDDQTWYRQELVSSPRDNVILEYGLFQGKLGRGRVVIVEVGKPRAATDLHGLTVLRASQQWARMEEEFNSWIRTLTPISSWRPPGEAPHSPFQASGKKSLFETGTQLIQEAKHRIALVAKTPVLLMGPRPYGSPRPYSYELEQFDIYQRLASNAAAGRSPSLLCVANRASVARDVERLPPAPLRTIQLNYTDIRERSQLPGSVFSYYWQENQSSMSYLVADDDFLIWTKDEGQESVWIVAQNENVANALHYQALRLGEAGDTAAMIADAIAYTEDDGAGS